MNILIFSAGLSPPAGAGYVIARRKPACGDGKG
jgi:hypothetical protein